MTRACSQQVRIMFLSNWRGKVECGLHELDFVLTEINDGALEA
jgi:hypothetical protein